MNEQNLQLAKMVHDVIHNKIVNIEIQCAQSYYGKRKIDETINDVNDYLNMLSVEEIYNMLLGHDFVDCSEIMNYLISDFNGKFMIITCFVPKKFNFKTDTLEVKETSMPGTLYAMMWCVLLALIFLVLYFNNK